jgi:hypothetical protein
MEDSLSWSNNARGLECTFIKKRWITSMSWKRRKRIMLNVRYPLFRPGKRELLFRRRSVSKGLWGLQVQSFWKLFWKTLSRLEKSWRKMDLGSNWRLRGTTLPLSILNRGLRISFECQRRCSANRTRLLWTTRVKLVKISRSFCIRFQELSSSFCVGRKQRFLFTIPTLTLTTMRSRRWLISGTGSLWKCLEWNSKNDSLKYWLIYEWSTKY